MQALPSGTGIVKNHSAPSVDSGLEGTRTDAERQVGGCHSCLV